MQVKLFSATLVNFRSLCGWIFSGYQSTRHTVISSHGHVVTRSTRHRSTRHRCVFSHSQFVTLSSRHTVISSQASIVQSYG